MTSLAWLADSSVEEPSPEIAEILNTLNLNDACLTGDISALLRCAADAVNRVVPALRVCILGCRICTHCALFAT